MICGNFPLTPKYEATPLQVALGRGGNLEGGVRGGILIIGGGVGNTPTPYPPLTPKGKESHYKGQLSLQVAFGFLGKGNTPYPSLQVASPAQSNLEG